jgi:hypothetical protein
MDARNTGGIREDLEVIKAKLLDDIRHKVLHTLPKPTGDEILGGVAGEVDTAFYAIDKLIDVLEAEE